MSILQIAIIVVVVIGLILVLIEILMLMRLKKVYKERERTTMYKKSFAAKLNLSTDENKELYNTVKNSLLSFEGVTTNLSWNNETFVQGEKQLAKINFRNEVLVIYLALDKNKVNLNKYNPYDCGNTNLYKQVPLRFRIRNEEELNQVRELIALTMKSKNIAAKANHVDVDYREENRGFDKLLQEELITPLTTFVPDDALLEWVKENGFELVKKDKK